MRDLLNRRVLLFGGKGGVGKTTCAAATALAASRAGRRVLLVSTDPAHSTSDMFGRPFAATEKEILPSLVGLEIDPRAEARRYITEVKERAATLFKGAANARALEQIDLAGSMPRIEDAALFDRLAGILTTRPSAYDLVIVDTAPTGHTLQLLRMPRAMAGWLRALADSRRHMLPDGDVETDEIVAALETRIARLDEGEGASDLVGRHRVRAGPGARTVADRRSDARGRVYLAGRELWEKVPEFEYTTPATSWVLSNVRWSVLILALWLAAAMFWMMRPLRSGTV